MAWRQVFGMIDGSLKGFSRISFQDSLQFRHNRTLRWVSCGIEVIGSLHGVEIFLCGKGAFSKIFFVYWRV